MYWIKRIDAKHQCSFVTNLNSGANFATPPLFHMGLMGLSWDMMQKLGWGVYFIIYHQVTIAGGNVVIGDHTESGAGAKVLPNIKIGSYVHVWANCVVVEDVPNNATVVLQKSRVLLNNKSSIIDSNTIVVK